MTEGCYLGTGEHGVGVGKKEYLNEELGAGTVDLMKTIKVAVDPLNLMNPGKVRFGLSLHGALLNEYPAVS